MIWAARRAGSVPLVPYIPAPSGPTRSAKPYFDTIMVNAAAQQTMIWVRMPASFSRLLRSYPMAAPQTQAISTRMKNSAYWERENCLARISAKVTGIAS